MIPLTKQQQNFLNTAVEYMKDHHGVEEEKAANMMDKYIRNIQVSDPTVQHLGPDYFAIQVLMQEKIIPYRPI